MTPVEQRIARLRDALTRIAAGSGEPANVAADALDVDDKEEA